VLEELEVGTPKADVLAALPVGDVETAPTGNVALVLGGYWRDRYLIDGRFVEVVWLHEPGEGFPESDVRRRATPMLFVNDSLDGWGWTHFDARREEWSWGVSDRPVGAPGQSEPPDNGGAGESGEAPEPGETPLPFDVPEPLEPPENPEAAPNRSA
jgi:hypothetical protein